MVNRCRRRRRRRREQTKRVVHRVHIYNEGKAFWTNVKK